MKQKRLGMSLKIPMKKTYKKPSILNRKYKKCNRRNFRKRITAGCKAGSYSLVRKIIYAEMIAQVQTYFPSEEDNSATPYETVSIRETSPFLLSSSYAFFASLARNDAASLSVV